jgi:serine/threonine protein kinase
MAKPHYSQDVYSFGILLWTLLAGSERPYGAVDFDSLKDLVREGVRPPLDEITSKRRHLPDKLMSLMTICWDADPAKRPKMVDILADLKSLRQPLKSAPEKPSKPKSSLVRALHIHLNYPEK